ncbi:hypothetical protein Hanom_Chr14g01270011 [Helianthus anomalus]
MLFDEWNSNGKFGGFHGEDDENLGVYVGMMMMAKGGHVLEDLGLKMMCFVEDLGCR